MDFEAVYKILDQSFDPSLHRSYDRQKKLTDNPLFNIVTKEKEGKTLGFITYWDFDSFIYAEHLAVDEALRGNGLGAELVKEVLNLGKPLILEVEPPETEIDKRRVKFYERLGLIFHNYEYYQPPYDKKFDFEKLFVMASKELNKEEFLKAVDKIFKNVYEIDIKATPMAEIYSL